MSPTTSPVGTWMVFGAAFPMNLLTNRMFAKVPRAITASLPRRDPYELNSRGVNLAWERSKGKGQINNNMNRAENFKQFGQFSTFWCLNSSKLII